MLLILTSLYVHYDPIIQNTIPAQIINVGQQYTFTFAANTFKSLGNTPLIYILYLGDSSALPPWLNFSSINSTFGGPFSRLSKDYIGNTQVLVTANDGQGGVVSTTFDIRYPSQFIFK